VSTLYMIALTAGCPDPRLGLIYIAHCFVKP